MLSSRRPAFKRSVSSPSDEADAERRSVRFLGIHKIVGSNRCGTGVSQTAHAVRSADVRQRTQQQPPHQPVEQPAANQKGQEEDDDNDDEDPDRLNLTECFVLLPREGVANVPFCAGGAATVGAVRGQLELQTGYTMTATRLRLRDRDLEETSELMLQLAAGEATATTLQLTVRPEFQELLDCVEADSCEMVRAWLAATRARQLRQPQPQQLASVVAVAHSGFVLACCRSKLDMVRIFLQGMPALANAATRETSRNGLHFACYHEQPRLCRLLLSRMQRAAVGIRDVAGHRPVDYAEAPPCRRIVLAETARPPTASARGGQGQGHMMTSSSGCGGSMPDHGGSEQQQQQQHEQVQTEAAAIRLFQLPLPSRR